MEILDQPSPNFNSREGHAVDMLVLHYTGMKTGSGAIEKLCDPTAKVSAHYVVEEDGRIFRLVEESNRAWHAGVSHWRGSSNINQRSIGIEIVNPGHEYGYRPFPKPQMEAVAELCNSILSRHSIPARNIVGHSDVAPARKQDPGELFDWKWLAGKGVGLFPVDSEKNNPLHPSPSTLHQYGYDVTNLPAAITAFQRHFRANHITGQWDSECDVLLHSLLDASI